jgi:hypothetical protein
MRPQVVVVGPLAASNATNIRTASAIAGAGAVVLNGTLVTGGVATLDKPRQILFTDAANDSGITFTLTGTDWAGDIISEVLTGANAGTVASVLSYATVTSVVSSGASAGNVSIGTSGVAYSPWARLDDFAMSQTALQCTASGTVNYTVQQSMDDPNSPTNPVTPALMTWVSSSDANVVGASTSQMSFFTFAPIFVRVLLNSGSGSVTMTVRQLSVTPL